MSDDVKLDGILLGNTCARDLMDQLPSEAEDMVSKLKMAQAWVLCVTAEYTKQHTGNLSSAQPWEFSIGTRDAGRALELQLQRRVKLGGTSLRNFLKSSFDRDSMTAARKFVAVFRKVARVSQERGR